MMHAMLSRFYFLKFFLLFAKSGRESNKNVDMYSCRGYGDTKQHTDYQNVCGMLFIEEMLQFVLQ
jgi:hypothetical protein